MKLVDILARELKEWPSDNADDYCLLTYEGNTVLFLSEAHPLKISQRPEDCLDLKVTRSQWQAAVDALKAGEQACDAECSPLVGVLVEIHRGDCCWIESDEWQIGKTANVMSVFENTQGREIAAIQFDSGHCECILTSCLRPARTAEQIASEERAAEVAEMINLSVEGHQAVTIAQARILCTQLHKAGYRRNPIQPARKGGSNERPAD